MRYNQTGTSARDSRPVTTSVTTSVITSGPPPRQSTPEAQRDQRDSVDLLLPTYYSLLATYYLLLTKASVLGDERRVHALEHHGPVRETE